MSDLELLRRALEMLGRLEFVPDYGAGCDECGWTDVYFCLVCNESHPDHRDGCSLRALIQEIENRLEKEQI